MFKHIACKPRMTKIQDHSYPKINETGNIHTHTHTHTHTHHISENLFMQMADQLVEGGFKDLGYKFVNIDVSWSYVHVQWNLFIVDTTGPRKCVREMSGWFVHKSMLLGPQKLS